MRVVVAGAHRAEDGVTLIEMLVALLVLAVALSGLASSMVTSLKAVNENERRTFASALQTEAIETLQTMPWSDVVLYTDDLTDVSADVDTAATPPEFEGRDLALLTGPADGSSCGDSTAPSRDPAIPCPLRTVQRGGVEYVQQTFITWIDRDGDGNEETKHFTVTVSWEDGGGRERSTRLDSERASTETLDIASGIRVLQFSVAPDPEQLVDDGDGSVESGEGRLTHDLQVVVRMSEKINDAYLKYFSVQPGDDDPSDSEYVDDAYLVERTAFLTKVEPDASGHTAVWTGTIPKGLGYYFAHGDNVFTLHASKGSTSVTARDTALFIGGPFSSALTSGGSPTPDGPAKPTITASPSPDPGTATSVSWSFEGDPEEGGFHCRLYFQVDTPPAYSPCASPFSNTLSSGDGTYVFEVYQVDLEDGDIGEVAQETYTLETNPPSSTDADISNWALSPNPICVDNSDDLTQDVNLDILVFGLAPSDPVQATYSYWSEGHRDKSPDATASVAATYVGGTAESGATFRVTIDKDVTHDFRKNASTTFTLTAGPRSDGQNDEVTTVAYPIKKNC